MINCCFNCTKRTIGCHATCKRYLEEKTRHEANKLEIDKIKASNNVYCGYMRCNSSKTRKRLGVTR